MTEPTALTMTGAARGPSLTALRASAMAEAKRFFGTECVSIDMPEATEVSPEVYHARFRAREHHERERPNYGPVRCRVCHREEYASGPPLPTSNWKE